jgi:hypothetical protein
VVNTSADCPQLLAMVDQVRANLGRKPDVCSADAGYCSEANLAGMAARHIRTYIATGRQKHGSDAAIHAKNGQPGSLIAARRDKLKRGDQVLARKGIKRFGSLIGATERRSRNRTDLRAQCWDPNGIHGRAPRGVGWPNEAGRNLIDHLLGGAVVVQAEPDPIRGEQFQPAVLRQSPLSRPLQLCYRLQFNHLSGGSHGDL